MSNLRSAIIRLANTNPKLRPSLLPLLAEGTSRVAAKKLSPFAQAYFKLWEEKAGMGDESDIDDMKEAYEAGEVTDKDLLANAPKSWKSKLPALKTAAKGIPVSGTDIRSAYYKSGDGVGALVDAVANEPATKDDAKLKKAVADLDKAHTAVFNALKPYNWD